MKDLVYKPKWGQYFQLTEKGIRYAMRIAKAMHKVNKKKKRGRFYGDVEYVYIPYGGDKVAFIARIEMDYKNNHHNNSSYWLIDLVLFKGY